MLLSISFVRAIFLKICCFLVAILIDEVFCDGQLQIFAPLTKVLHIILLIGGNMLLTISFATAMLPLLIITCWSR